VGAAVIVTFWYLFRLLKLACRSHHHGSSECEGCEGSRVTTYPRFVEQRAVRLFGPRARSGYCPSRSRQQLLSPFAVETTLSVVLVVFNKEDLLFDILGPLVGTNSLVIGVGGVRVDGALFVLMF
jgi:hypothetical protein